MESYAALLSLMITVEQIEDHPRLPLSLDKQQVESLTKHITFLQEFLESYTSPPLETRIAAAASEAQDAIENYIVHVIQLARVATGAGQDVEDSEGESSSDEQMDLGQGNSSEKEKEEEEEEMDDLITISSDEEKDDSMLSEDDETISSDEEIDDGGDTSSDEETDQLSGLEIDLAALTVTGGEKERCCQDLEKVIGEMDKIKKDVKIFLQKSNINNAVDTALNRSDKMAERLKKLRISVCYDERAEFKPFSYYYINSVALLQGLKSLDCSIDGGRFLVKHNFLSLSLKKLSVEADGMQWDGMLKALAPSLPLLEKLQLYFGSFEKHRWTTVEGQFPRLKFLRLFGCHGLKDWKTKSSHFPRLEHLVLASLKVLEEIPSGIGNLRNLKSIRISRCNESLVRSAKGIVEERKAKSGGGTSLKVRVTLWESNEELEKLASPPEFKVEVI